MKHALTARALITPALLAGVAALALVIGHDPAPPLPHERTRADVAARRDSPNPSGASPANPGRNRIEPALGRELPAADRADFPPATPAPPSRRDQLNALYFGAAQRQPELAVETALRLTAPDERRFAVESALAAWSHRDPHGLAEAALAFPAGPEQDAALTKALRSWLISDPGTAGDWIFAHPTTVAIAETIFQTENR